MRIPFPPPPSEAGSALVEYAIVFPVFVVALFGALQLTLIQHARLAVQYAAYAAVRSGSVENLDPERMRTAARTALLPLDPRVDTLERLPAALLRSRLRPVEVSIVRPTLAMFEGRDELDFDAQGDEPRRTEAVVRVLYLYEMRIPGVNALFFKGLSLRALLLGDSDGSCPRSFDRKSHLKAAALSVAGRYFIPLEATWSMRMQSNPFRDFVREAGCEGGTG